MPEGGWLRLRNPLTGLLDPPVWPEGIAPRPFTASDRDAVHAVLHQAFPGLVAPVADWYGNLTADPEYDPELCIAAVGDKGDIVGLIQGWTTDFIKDLAVAPAFRRQGIATALLRHAFLIYAARGASHVDLKVGTDEMAARRLYRSLGMIETDP